MDDIKFKIMEDESWDVELSKPTQYIPLHNFIFIKGSYYDNMKKTNILSYYWIVFEYANYIFYTRKKILLNDFQFPGDERSKFAFAYMFYWLKSRGIKDFIELNKDADLMKLYFKNNIIKTYFTNAYSLLQIS